MKLWDTLLLLNEKEVSVGRFLWFSFGNLWLKLFFMMAQITAQFTMMGVLCRKVGYCNFGLEGLTFLVLAACWMVITTAFNVPVLGSLLYLFATTEIIKWTMPQSAWFIYPLGFTAVILADIRQMYLMKDFAKSYKNPILFEWIPIVLFVITLPVFAHWYIWALFRAENLLNTHTVVFTASVFTCFMLYAAFFPKEKTADDTNKTKTTIKAA